MKQVTIKANLRSIMQHKKRRESSRGALTLSSSSLGFHTTHQASSSIPPPPSTSALSTTSSSSEANTLLFPPNKPLDTDVNAAQLAIEYLIGSPFLEEEASDAEKGDRTKGVPAHYLSRCVLSFRSSSCSQLISRYACPCHDLAFSLFCPTGEAQNGPTWTYSPSRTATR